MDRVAKLPASQRGDLFSQSAARRGLREAIIEKDFWVCWVLKQLFTDASLQSRLVFKGGTSLSKVFQLIDRFSEDVDLVLDWTLLGYGSEKSDPKELLLSKTQQDRFNKQINAEAASHIGGPLLAKLVSIFSVIPGLSVAIDERDPHCIDVSYPASFKADYVLPKVRLEIGPLASWVPSASYSIHPYASEDFPEVFRDPVCPVVAIAAERTFWEKATILHKEARRAGPIPTRHSRHYYDLFKLANSPVCEVALAKVGLLRDVVEFKTRFYPSAWARYDLAIPGSFQISPKADQLTALAKDYREMSDMLFGEIPNFDTIIGGLAELELKINRLTPPPK